ncbi:ABC transporter ATP-binding protein [Pendulispora albinea]|uniref:ABC transporter ATP-binding protein/permease n=1 Tax=Pendulispora albinea TaxID=2741071 RepID=A0ABZ2LV28_9BACT
MQQTVSRPPAPWRRAWSFVRPDRTSLVGILLLGTTSALVLALEPLVLKCFFDALIARAGLAPLMGIVGLLALMLLAREAVAGLLEWLVWRTRIDINFRMTSATIDRLHTLPLSFHQRHSVGALMAKVDRGITGTVTAFSTVFVQILPSIIYLIMAIVIMLRLEWRLGLLVLAFAPIPAILGARASREQVTRERRLLERWSRVFARFNEALAGMTVVKSFAREESEKHRFLKRVDAANRLVMRGVATDVRVEATKNAVVVIARVTAVSLGGYLIAAGAIPIGTLIAFLGYVGGAFQPVQSLTSAYQTTRRGQVALKVVFSILDAEDTVLDSPDAHDAGPLRGSVEFRDVSFGYGGRPLLDRVNIAVNPGETVALVGPSGAGKTTLMALLQRLHDPTSGSVHVDGLDLRSLKQRSVRSQIGVVLQEGLLFSDSVRSNIAFGRPHATDDEIEHAARAANAHDFVSKLPRGYATRVGERGSTLSGGERQRLAIARALLKDAPILILDEATSALDAESESLVQEALGRLMVGRTTFIIAHRLATVVRADRILVLKDGSIVESGTHAELLRARGYYASLVDHQVRGLIDVDERAA